LFAAQFRRVSVIDLWDSNCSQLSLNKLIVKAYTFSQAKTGGESASEKWFDLVDSKIFYWDEDGDGITISSNEELMDLFKTSPSSISITIDTAAALNKEGSGRISKSLLDKLINAP
jgi:hypothetical protein